MKDIIKEMWETSRFGTIILGAQITYGLFCSVFSFTPHGTTGHLALGFLFLHLAGHSIGRFADGEW